MRSLIMKYTIALVTALFMHANLSAYELPKISASLVADVERISMVLDLADFPISQRDVDSQLELPKYQTGTGESASGNRTYQLCPISDKSDPIGYYALIIYTDNNSSEGDIIFTDIKVAYVPTATMPYPATGPFIRARDSGQILDSMRIRMKNERLTPAAYVRKIYKK